ncbi:MAG: putative box helicase domain protein [Parcubacteria group bacterium]|nr:putative box helicase domain protein [Parcubacteria group bacterium]
MYQQNNSRGDSRGNRPDNKGSRGPARSGSRTPRPSGAYEAGMRFAEAVPFGQNVVRARPFDARRGPSRGPSGTSRGGSSRGGNDRGGNSQGGPRRSGGRNIQEMNIDLTRLINKAQPAEDVVTYVSKNSFADFKVDDRLKANIIGKGYITPTPIQDESIPVVLEGRDIVGMANTGTGKTAAFLIPLIDKVLKYRALNERERVLIMVPTRELAIQIEQEFFGFAKGLQLGSVTCVGGANIGPQIRVLKRNPEFVIGTPGRLKDLMERRELDLSGFGTVVLDEADRMLDMGFIADMRFILAKMKAERHTLFFSATMSRDIEALIHTFLKNPARISVKTRDTSHTIDQDVIRADSHQKFDILVDLLKQPGFERVIIFGRTKHGVERLTRDLFHKGIKAESIHGDKTHGARQKALGYFKRGEATVLVATDVAARGLDISGVSHVINYDLPGTYEDYTHRIGRTGRAGVTGTALTFIPTSSR